MRNLKSFLVTTLAVLALTACSNSSRVELEQSSAAELYQKAHHYMQEEDYTEALRYLEATDNYYPQTPYAQQAALNMIYVHYKSKEYTQALTTAERFLRTYPTSQNLDYVLYLAGLTNSQLADDSIQRWFKVDRAVADTSPVINAFHNFQTLLKNFPNSIYATDARNRMIALKERLARHELNVVNFYNERKAYVAVVNRIEDMLRKFPDTKATYKALPILENAYMQLDLPKQAQTVRDILKANENIEFYKEEKLEDLSKPQVMEN